MKANRSSAISANVGLSRTSSSVVPWMADTSSGIGIPGLISSVRLISSPSGIAFSIEISTILSFPTFKPVVSKSKKTKGLVKLNFILLFDYFFRDNSLIPRR